MTDLLDERTVAVETRRKQADHRGQIKRQQLLTTKVSDNPHNAHFNSTRPMNSVPSVEEGDTT